MVGGSVHSWGNTMCCRPYPFHGRLILKALALNPPGLNAVIWSLTQMILSLEGR